MQARVLARDCHRDAHKWESCGTFEPAGPGNEKPRNLGPSAADVCGVAGENDSWPLLVLTAVAR